MTKEQRDKLRTLALAATPGEFKPFNASDVLALLDRIDKLDAQLAAVKVDADRYKDAVSDAFTALDETGEINLCNYDHDHVCQMNAAYCEAVNIIYEAMRQE